MGAVVRYSQMLRNRLATEGRNSLSTNREGDVGGQTKAASVAYICPNRTVIASQPYLTVVEIEIFSAHFSGHIRILGLDSSEIIG